MKILRAMKALFMGRSFREKAMVVLFLLAIAVVWVNSLFERSAEVSEELASVGLLLHEQEIILDNEEEIEARMRAGVENLDPRSILSGTRLVGELDSIAQRHGLRREIRPPRSDEGAVFTFHVVDVVINNANIGTLMAFADDVQARAPYMGLESVGIRRDQNNPHILRADFRISSVELAN